MDHNAVAKAREAGVEPPEESPPVSKKCFMFLVFLLLTGGIVAIVCVLKSGAKEEKLEAIEVTTTARPTTVPISKLTNDEEVLARCKSRYTATLGKSTIGMMSTGISDPTDSKVQLKKGSFWLRGIEQEDKSAFKQIRVMACKGFIPTILIQIRPQGYKLILNQDELVHYDGEEIHEDWLAYDIKLKEYQKVLKDIPALVILEPKLLQLTFNIKNLQYNYENGIYIEEFLQRAQQTTNALKKSWVYIDAGDPGWLSEDKHLEHAAQTLNRVQGIRGFAMNTGFFANMTYTEKIARKIACRTDLRYVVDTGRNGGDFSQQELEKIEACRYDPPNIKASNKPMWGYATKKAVANKAMPGRRRRGIYDSGIGGVQPAAGPRGWSNGVSLPSAADRALMRAAGGPFPGSFLKNSNKGSETAAPKRKTGKIFAKTVRTAPANTGRPAGPPVKKTPAGKLQGKESAEDRMNKIMFKNKRAGCFGDNSKMTRMDAYIWAKTAGQSDGRILNRGTYDPCLLKHSLKCDGQCGLIVNPPCTCSGPSQPAPSYGGYPPAAVPFPGYPPAGVPFGYQPAYHQPAYGG